MAVRNYHPCIILTLAKEDEIKNLGEYDFFGEMDLECIIGRAVDSADNEEEYKVCVEQLEKYLGIKFPIVNGYAKIENPIELEKILIEKERKAIADALLILTDDNSDTYSTILEAKEALYPEREFLFTTTEVFLGNYVELAEWLAKNNAGPLYIVKAYNYFL